MIARFAIYDLFAVGRVAGFDIFTTFCAIALVECWRVAPGDKLLVAAVEAQRGIR